MRCTIAVPVYNTGKYLFQCLDSLTAQTLGDIEILLIDDGSTDQSGSVCDAYARRDTRVRVLHKENGGVSSARNLAIDQARGEYLLFVDSDDCIHREMAEIYMQALEHSDTQAVWACDYTKQQKELLESRLVGWKAQIEEYDRSGFLQFMKDEYVNAPWNKLYKVAILREYGIRFDETKSLGEDFLFNLEYFRYAPAVYKVIHCPLYFYREGREGSLANAFAPQLFSLQVEMFETLGQFLQECRVWSQADRREYYQLYWNRLYLVIKIFLEYRKKEIYPEDVDRILGEALEDSSWEKVWNAYRKEGRVTWKDWAKKLHLGLALWKYGKRGK